MSQSWDVLVVGAGPAGSSAALAAASAGAAVLLVESKRRVGALPHCAEFVPRALGLELDMPPRAVVQKVAGMETRLGQGANFAPAPGWILDRQVFDFELAARAAEAGAQVWTSTSFLGSTGDSHRLRRAGEPLTVKARVLVAAWGAAQVPARALGLPPLRLFPGRQLVVPLAAPLERTLVFLEPAFSQGYAWLFPRGSVANLGLGCAPQARPRWHLDDLQGRILAQGLVRPGVLARTVGAIPVGGPRPALVDQGLILCGDAAGLTHPLSGAGIPQAIFSGAQAGLAAAALAGGQPAALDEYAHQIALRYARYLARGLEARGQWEAGWSGPDFSALMAATWPGWVRAARAKRVG